MQSFGMVQKQRPPKSIRLHPEDFERSDELADKLNLTWHGWIVTLIRWSNKQKLKQIKMIAEIEDQERCS
jgi:hypothetical protein